MDKELKRITINEKTSLFCDHCINKSNCKYYQCANIYYIALKNSKLSAVAVSFDCLHYNF